MTNEQIRACYGTPTEIDETPLSEDQALFLARSVERLGLEAGHSHEVAIALSVRAFRASFEVVGGAWVSRRFIPLGKNGGRILEHVFHRRAGGQ